MNSPDFEARALKMVKDYWETANPKGVRVIERVPEFLGGYLYIVEITDQNGKDHENLVLRKNSLLRRFDNLRDLTGAVPNFSLGYRMLEPPTLVLTIAGLITLVIVVTFSCLVIRDPSSSAKDILAGVLTLVVGFMFGKTTSLPEKKQTSS